MRAAEEAIKAESTEWVDIIDGIQEAHIAAAREVVRARAIFDEFRVQVETECENLRGFLGAAQVSFIYSFIHSFRYAIDRGLEG